jgi:DNA-binding protein H-NS
MKRSDIEVDIEIMSTEQLWVLHQKITTMLKAMIIAETKVLEDRLSQLNGWFRVEQTSETPERRSYPTVFPNFRIPNNVRKPGRAGGSSRAG